MQYQLGRAGMFGTMNLYLCLYTGSGIAGSISSFKRNLYGAGVWHVGEAVT